MTQPIETAVVALGAAAAASAPVTAECKQCILDSSEGAWVDPQTKVQGKV